MTKMKRRLELKISTSRIILLSGNGTLLKGQEYVSGSHAFWYLNGFCFFLLFLHWPPVCVFYMLLLLLLLQVLLKAWLSLWSLCLCLPHVLYQGISIWKSRVKRAFPVQKGSGETWVIEYMMPARYQRTNSNLVHISNYTVHKHL